MRGGDETGRCEHGRSRCKHKEVCINRKLLLLLQAGIRLGESGRYVTQCVPVFCQPEIDLRTPSRGAVVPQLTFISVMYI